MYARRDRKSDRSSIDNVLDDLLASDDQDAPKKTYNVKKDAPVFKPIGNQKKLSAKASDAEFYSSLKSLGGEQIEESEEEELSDDAVKRLAAEIGDLDDLDNDLFSGFGGNEKKKVESKPAGSASKGRKKPLTKSSNIDSAYDPDDPLAGLGLSDDDLDASINKKKTSKKSLLTRTLSHEKAKIEPHSGVGDESDEGKLSVSLEKGDPFLTSLTSASSRLKVKQNSEEHLAPLLNTSDSDVSPRNYTKQKKAKSRRKGSVEPSGTSDADTDFDGGVNKPKSMMNQSNESIDILKPNKVIKGRQSSENVAKKKKEDDLFGDSDGLPDMSDDESPPKKVKPVKQLSDEDMPLGKATNALDTLLNSSPSRGSKKQQEPTMLDKIMAGKSVNVSKNEEKTGYSPSIASDRPTTAPTRRSVTFADQLGIDTEGSVTDRRPITAPESKKYAGRKKKSELDFDSDFDETTKEWLSLSKSKQESPAKDKGSNPKKKAARQKSNDDWLGLGEDLTDKLESSGEFFNPKNEKKMQVDKEIDNNSVGNQDKSFEVKDDKLAAEDNSLLLPWESPSRKLGPKPGSRHRTPEKEKPKETEKLVDSLQSNNISSDAIIGNITDGKKDENDFLNLLKKNKPKKEESKDENPSVNTKEPEVKASVIINTEDDPFVARQNRIQKTEPKIENKNSNIISSHPGKAESNVPALTKNEIPRNPPVPSTDIPAQESSVLQMLQQLLLQQQQTPPKPSVTTINTMTENIHLPNNTQIMKEEIMKDLNARHQEEYNAAKRQFDRDKVYLETELKELQQKVIKMEENQSSSSIDYSKTIRELEAAVRKLELERDQLLISMESLKHRHKSEIDSLESSHKTRIGFLEDSYKRREQQWIDESQMEKLHLDGKLKAYASEKEDLLNSFKKKSEFMEKNKITEIDRLKSLHGMAVQDLIREHNDQIEHLRLLKEQEVAAAVSAFSHTKSLQTLMNEVRDSTRQVGDLQLKIDAAHKSKTDDHVMTLKSRDEYLKNLENRLGQQEKGNEEERQRLQNLISKMEIQLRDQTRQIEQDKWKLTQDENRLKTMQSSFEEEKHVLMEQIMQDRDQVNKAREEMLVDQRKIIAKCYTEKQKIEDARTQLLLMKKDTVDVTKDRSFAFVADSDFEANLSKLQQESSSINSRIAYIKQEEQEIKNEKEQVLKERKQLDTEREELQAAGELLKKRSKEIEELSIEAKRVHDDGVKAIEEADSQKREVIDANNQIEHKTASLKQMEITLHEEQSKFEIDRKVFEREKESNACYICKSPLTPAQIDPRNTYLSPALPQFSPNVNQMYASVPSGYQSNQMFVPARQPPNQLPYAPHNLNNNIQYIHSPDTNNNNAVESTYNSLQNHTPVNSSQPLDNNPVLSSGTLPPPDILMNSFEFKRAMRRYSDAKENDDTFFEEETRFLKRMREKRLR